ncbi:MAG: hypothetical protein AAGA58_15225 [Verrucomicrobiota bacterium]
MPRQRFLLAILVPIFSTSGLSALEVVENPGTNVSPTSVINVQTIFPFPGLMQGSADFSVGGFFGLMDNNTFHRGSAPFPDESSALASSGVIFYSENGPAQVYGGGAQPGDDNWIYITSNNDVKAWAQVDIDMFSLTVLRYVHNPDAPLAPITLSDALDAVAGGGTSVPRDVQIRSVDFDNGIVELYNFGPSAVDLDGWRFCTHDENEDRRYSSSSGLNGETIEAGTSLFIYFNNDAPGGGDSDNLNRSSLGNFALPLDTTGAYAMQLYFPPISFGNGATIADNLQWSLNGLDNTSADFRSGAAQSGGVWANQSQWIDVSGVTTNIYLTDPASTELHGPNDYIVIPDFQITEVDYNPPSGDVIITFPDINNLVVDVERSTTLESDGQPGDWTIIQSTSNNQAFVADEFGDKTYFRLKPQLPGAPPAL